MKAILFTLFFLFVEITCIAQPETGKKSKSFPILEMPKAASLVKKTTDNPFSNPNAINQEPLFTPNNNPFFEKKKPSFEIGINNSPSLSKTQTFENPNLDVLDKLNGLTPKEVSENFKEVRGNQDLGRFNSSSKFVNIKYRDFGEVDGDNIRVYLNGIVVASSVTLDHDFQGLEILLQKGFNKIDFEALNQGTSGPNTAEFRVYDDNKKLISSNQWNLATGFKATIMVVKD
jgi:hypothetical protein